MRNVRVHDRRFGDVRVIGPDTLVVVRECVRVVEDADAVHESADRALVGQLLERPRIRLRFGRNLVHAIDVARLEAREQLRRFHGVVRNTGHIDQRGLEIFRNLDADDIGRNFRHDLSPHRRVAYRKAGLRLIDIHQQGRDDIFPDRRGLEFVIGGALVVRGAQIPEISVAEKRRGAAHFVLAILAGRLLVRRRRPGCQQCESGDGGPHQSARTALVAPGRIQRHHVSFNPPVFRMGRHYRRVKGSDTISGSLIALRYSSGARGWRRAARSPEPNS